ncbi:MAG TPA: tetratricopeptide repeat protein [Stellaceae bacterium]|nr:tetratricopeptide repeat protein [Stellaceae bacterium]
MRGVLIASGLALTAALYAAPSAAEENWAICAGINGSYTPQQEIAACTDIIESPATKSSELDSYYNNRAIAYMRLNQYDVAISDFTQAIAHFPTGSSYKDDLYYIDRAWAYHLKGEDANALPDANKAIAMNPDDPGYFETRGEIYETLGQRDQAIADYRAALKLDPKKDASRQGLQRLGGAP